MKEIVNVVVTCTKRKTQLVPERLKVQSLRKGTCRDRIRDWLGRLKESKVQPVPVSDLYAGDHWCVVRDILHREWSGFRVRMWVVSAGCGVVPLTQSLKPYSATFSADHPDSVVTADVQASEWWASLTNRRQNPLRKVAEMFPDSPMLVAASATYLRAVRQDIVDSAGALESPELLSIISAGTRSLAGLDDHLLPCDARMKTCVGGALRSLNVRVLRKLLVETEHDLPVFSALKNRLEPLLAQQPEFTRFDRRKMTDDEVKRYIASGRRKTRLSRSRLLRDFRDQGFACSERRFRKLFETVAGSPK